MSHVATVELQVRDPEALRAAAARLGLGLRHGEVRFYDGTTVQGAVIHLPGWRYPVVLDAQGTLHYDTYGGRWGDLAQLHRLRQAYAEAVTTRWARRQGYQVRRQTAPDGTIRLELSR